MKPVLPLTNIPKQLPVIVVAIFLITVSAKLDAQHRWLSRHNGSYNSDYYVYFRYSGLYFTCDCSNQNNTSKIKINDGSWFTLGTKLGESYTGNDYKIPIGAPSLSFNWMSQVEEGGRDNKGLGICWTDCKDYWPPTTRTYSTGSLRSPGNVNASDRKSDHKVEINWDKRTDVLDILHGYIIYRDGSEIGRTTGSVRSFVDPGLQAGESYSYSVRTMYPYMPLGTPSKLSGADSDIGSTFSLNLIASTNDDVIHLDWDHMKYNGDFLIGNGGTKLEEYIIYRYDEVNDDTYQISKSRNINAHLDNVDLIPGYTYEYTLQPIPDDEFHASVAYGKTLPNGTISGRVTTRSGKPVVNIKVCAIRKDTVPQDTTSIYCALTNSDGDFSINGIYYFTESELYVKPIKVNHGFEPSIDSITLDEINHIGSGLFFTDTSAVTVFGQVVQIGNQGECPVEGVEIYLNQNDSAEAVTNEKGLFVISLDEIDDYSFKPVLDTHYFYPDSLVYFIQSDSTLETIIDTTEFTLSGYVTASCFNYIGKAKLYLTAEDTSGTFCYDTILDTDTLIGYYEIKLPANKYSLQLTKFFSEDADIEDTEVESYFFNPVDIDLTFGDVVQNFTYRQELQIHTTFSNYGCGADTNLPILFQGVYDTVDIEIKEAYGDSVCNVSDGYVVITNHIGNESETIDTLILQNGVARYPFVAGYPNYTAPYLRDIVITAYVAPEELTNTIDVLVVGNKPRTQTFTTVSPELPMMILRDPPGDGSYSYLEENTTTETAMRFSTQLGGSVNAWAEVKAGTKFEAGLGVTVETEVYGSIKGALDVGGAITDQDEHTVTITNGQMFSTSENENVVGESGDVFIGAAYNLIYALSDVVEYDFGTCTASNSVALCMGIKKFETTYIYTQDFIENAIIPDLTYLKNLYESNGNDSSRIYENQIEVWHQTLDINRRLKENSTITDQGNLSFSGNVVFESWIERGSSKSTTHEFSAYIEPSVAIEAGLEVGGVGASGGVEVKFRYEYGESKTTTVTKTHKTGFTLQDDENLDAFTLDVLVDEVYGSPVFKLKSGRSSCPWEPGTQPRDGVQLLSDSYYQNIPTSDGQAVFSLQLANQSQSNETRPYLIEFDQASNPDGAIVTLGGNPAIVPVEYVMESGQSNYALVTVSRGPLAFDYENLMFRMYPECDESAIADTVLLDVHFKNECSDINITQPATNWSISDRDLLRVTLGGYDVEKFNSVILQVANVGKYNWRTVGYDTASNFNPEETNIYADFEFIEDGEFILRAVVNCDIGKNYSLEIPGKVDRIGPEIYGIPEPSDLVLDSTNIISVTFNEDIDCEKIFSAAVTVTNISTNTVLNASLGCSDDRIIIVPDFTGNDYTGDTMVVELSGIFDLVGNEMNGIAEWSFSVGNYNGPDPSGDTDEDGITDGSDNCPYTYNPAQGNVDKDSDGDKCDTDIDNDEVLNIDDNCPFVANADQLDDDHDAIGNACDFDRDNDLIPDSTDNCPDIPNSDQADYNKDSIGDACQLVLIDEIIVDNEVIRLMSSPNPFNNKTLFTVDIPFEGEVILKVFNVLGKEIKTLMNDEYLLGSTNVEWDASGYDHGIYYCTIVVRSLAKNSVATKTIKLIKVD